MGAGVSALIFPEIFGLLRFVSSIMHSRNHLTAFLKQATNINGDGCTILKICELDKLHVRLPNSREKHSSGNLKRGILRFHSVLLDVWVRN